MNTPDPHDAYKAASEDRLISAAEDESCQKAVVRKLKKRVRLLEDKIELYKQGYSEDFIEQMRWK